VTVKVGVSLKLEIPFSACVIIDSTKIGETFHD